MLGGPLYDFEAQALVDRGSEDIRRSTDGGARRGLALGAAAATLGLVLVVGLVASVAPARRGAAPAAAARSEAAGRLLEGSGLSAFLELDHDGDQMLSWTEFSAAMEHFNPPLTPEQAEYSFASFDTDRDLQVSAEEYLGKGVAEQTKLTHQQKKATDHAPLKAKAYVTCGEFKDAVKDHSKSSEQAYASLDSDHDGAVDRAEFEKDAQNFGFTVQQAKYIFNVLDANNDGNLLPVDFFSALEGHGSADSPLHGIQLQATSRIRMAMDVPSGQTKLTVEQLKFRMGSTMLSDAYLNMDTDGDGFLAPEDFTSSSANSVFSPPLSPEEADYVFRGLDSNGDGAVCIAEFFGVVRIGEFYQTPDKLQAVGAYVKTKPQPTAPPQAQAPAQPWQQQAQPLQQLLVAPAFGAGLPSMPAGDAAGPAPPITAAQYHARLATPAAEDAFSAMDGDADGKLGIEEYRSTASMSFSPPLSPKEVEYTFKGFDADSDNSISPNEFFGVLNIGHFFQTPQAIAVAAGQPEPVIDDPAPMPVFVPAVPAPSALAPLDAPPAPAPSGPVASPSSQVAPLTEAGFVERMQTSHASPQEAFSAMDEGGDGALNFDDFVSGARSFSSPLDDTQAMYSFKGFDSNDDHRISKAEFFGVLSLGHFFQTQQAIDAAFAAVAPTSQAPQDTAAADFDCNADLEDFEFAWSEEQQSWCCAHEHKGCSASKLAPAPAPAASVERPLPVPAAEVGAITVRSFIQRMGTAAATPQDAFDQLDVNHDGFFVVDELRSSRAAFTPALTDDEAAASVAGFDANSDHKVCLAEFTSAIRRRSFYTDGPPNAAGTGPDLKVWQATSEPMTLSVFTKRMQSSYGSPKPAFDGMDTDKDKYLSMDEFKAGAGAFESHLTGEEAEYAFAGFDIDGDEMVCQDEFMGVMSIGRFYPSKAALAAASIVINKPAIVPTTTLAPTTTETVAVTLAPQASTTTNAWETQKAPIDVPTFLSQMGTAVPQKLNMLQSQAGGCVDLNTFRAAASDFNPPLTSEQADYAFCGMDENHDKKVCSFEFFGILKIGQFFPSRSHLEHLREVGALTERPGEGPHDLALPPPPSGDVAAAAAAAAAASGATRSAAAAAAAAASTAAPVPALVAPAPAASPAAEAEERPKETKQFKVPGTPVEGADLKKYKGVPAIVNGQAEITLHLSSSETTLSTDQINEIGKLFGQAMTRKLNLDVSVAGVESFRAEGGDALDRSIIVLWTAGSVDDGGALQAMLQRKAGEIERSIEDLIAEQGFDWLTRSAAWSKISLSYYGPQASSLSKGQKLVQEIGHKQGAESENGSPSYAPLK